MRTTLTSLAVALALGSLASCGGGGDGGNQAGEAQTGKAKDAAGDKTIATGLGSNGRFAALAKTAGLDQTLAGPGPYTVFVPDDAAIAKVPAETSAAWSKPEGRGEVTRLLTYHIVPGVVLADDLGKAIDRGKGKAQIITMGGGTLTAAKEGGSIVITDGNGGKVTVTKADEQYLNGAVHHIDGVLTPGKN
ncbi:fasciclin domain-containing protein [Sphingomonas piscis]|uniref:Fasciclin domain-containing protein n=1 Tax=Sphingomonas piscis TaxID=2714943 RepID=A0A6G7YPT0_9SPHN|nr:fasciclin domain-containing protein [Sphingomonas piscis]QIK78744.1 fasciclin domain-containing protein [Sphingomonas piscis]